MFEFANLQELEKVSSEILTKLQKVFGDEIICALTHGSCVKGGMIKGFSDLDVQVFLQEESFDEFGLRLEKSIAIQELTGDINLSKLGANYLQMYFHNPKEMPYLPELYLIFGQTKNRETVKSLGCSDRKNVSALNP